MIRQAITEDTLVVKAFGKRLGDPLATHKGVVTIGDLLEFIPRRYLTPLEPTDLGDLIVGEPTTVVARVRDVALRPMRQRRGKLLTAVIGDGRHELDLTFFKPYPHVDRLVRGSLGIFTGTVGRYAGRLQLTHPEYVILDEQGDAGADEAVRDILDHQVPVYPATGSVTSLHLRTTMGVVLDSLDRVREPIPESVRHARGLLDRRAALELVHRPAVGADVEPGLRRLRFDEAFVLQTILAQRRRAAAQSPSVPRVPRADGLLAAFDARLPFTLTAGQLEVSAALMADLAKPHPMQRLLQGEVGSGKTVVALRAMLAVVDAGGQAALLAPTEVLAAQHFRSIKTLLGPLATAGMLPFGGQEEGSMPATSVALLTGSQGAAERRTALASIASGAAGIVVGTHALIQRHVEFDDLGLVVVDEQHRFGVEQRDALREKGKNPPHVLVMTATPIPRTVAMTVFGDLETVTLRELPAGRSPITTHVVDAARPSWVARTWARVAEEVGKGHQVYVVCPKIGEMDPDVGGPVASDRSVSSVPSALSAAEEGADLADEVADDLDGGDGTGAEEAGPPRELAGVYAVTEQLRADPVLADLRIGMLHGRLDADTKDRVMTDFAAGRLDVLVATTVIEVGVDVPNASMMVVLDADRFGLSQLHQLRGRVGRGAVPGLCLLMTSVEAPSARERLDALASTTDGFELARRDVHLRREGDILGARQSGRGSSVRFLRLGYASDEALIDAARHDASALVDLDPTLAEHADLAARVTARLDEDQAAYLERG